MTPRSTRVPPADAGELPRLLRLAWPVVVGQLGIVAMGAVDVAMVGALSKGALAAVGIGHIFSFGLLIPGLGLLSGLDPLFSQRWGAGDRSGLGRVLAQGLVLATWAAIPLTLLHLFAGPLLVALNQPPDVVPIATAYCHAVAVGVLPGLLYQALARFLQGQGEMKLPMQAVLVGNAVNVVANAALVFGVEAGGRLVVPAMGAVGCGVATAGVRWAMFLSLVLLAKGHLRSAAWPRIWEAISPAGQAALLRIGGPVGLQVALEVWAFNATGLMMGMLGSVPVAAHAVAMNLISITFMIPHGIGAAASTRVGNLIGAQLTWRKSAWLAVGTGAAWMTLTSVLLAVVPEHLALVYTREAEVVALAALLLPVAAAFQLFDGVQVVVFGVLRGAGDTRLPALVNLVGYWICGLPLAYWLGVHHGWGPRWVWGGLVVGLFVVAVSLLVRLRWLMREGAPSQRLNGDP